MKLNQLLATGAAAALLVGVPAYAQSTATQDTTTATDTTTTEAYEETEDEGGFDPGLLGLLGLLGLAGLMKKSKPDVHVHRDTTTATRP